MHELSNQQREEIEKLAYQMWEERGGPLGSPEEDWYRAERQLLNRSHWPAKLPFSALSMEPMEH